MLEEKLYLEINGIRQGMFLQSDDTDNPVLLFLHGGPGSPEIAFVAEKPAGLEKVFTVCWWEQRGSGISYHRSISRETMTVSQLIADTVAVANYLRQRFGKEKIYLMGHSWGSVLGLLTVRQVPEPFRAYIGIGQVVCQMESEQLAYTYMLDEFRAAGDRKMVRKLEKFPIDKGAGVGGKYLAVRGEGLTKLGIGMMHSSFSMWEEMMPIFRFRGYTWRERIKYVRGNLFSVKCLWDTVLESDYAKQVPRLEVPFYVLHGKFDYQVSYALAREYVRSVEAPVKGFYTFEDSAHSPFLEEPEKMIRILRMDVLQGKAELADELRQ